MKIAALAAVLGTLAVPILYAVPSASAQTSHPLAVSYQTITLHRTKKYDIKARYPVFAGNFPVVQLANRNARAAAQRMANEFVKRTLRDEKEFGKEGFHGDYTMELKPTISAARPDLVSFYFERYAYLGGPHPSTDYTTMNFGMVGGQPKQLELRDVFKPGFNPYGGLDPYLMPVLKQRNASSITDGMLKTLGKTELKNWCFSMTGLTFIFEPYAVASYAEGTFIVKKPFAELKKVIAPQGPLVELL